MCLHVHHRTSEKFYVHRILLFNEAKSRLTLSPSITLSTSYPFIFSLLLLLSFSSLSHASLIILSCCTLSLLMADFFLSQSASPTRSLSSTLPPFLLLSSPLAFPLLSGPLFS